MEPKTTFKKMLSLFLFMNKCIFPMTNCSFHEVFLVVLFLFPYSLSENYPLALDISGTISIYLILSLLS